LYINDGLFRLYKETGATAARSIFYARASTSDFYVYGNITAYSDERLKENIETIENSLEKVSQLRGVSYDRDERRNIGLVAQEVMEVIPEVVSEGADGYYSVAYGNIVGLLVEAIKELKKEVELLKNGTAK